MLKVVCPECGEEWVAAKAEVALHSQFQCEECGSILVVVREDPLKIEVDTSSEIMDDDEFQEFDDEDDD